MDLNADLSIPAKCVCNGTCEALVFFSWTFVDDMFRQRITRLVSCSSDPVKTKSRILSFNPEGLRTIHNLFERPDPGS